MHTSAERFDVILIGSGIGSLSCGSILSQMLNKRVLILERHFKIGGFTHTFKRKGQFEWDVGVHYVGEMHHGSIPRAIFDYITRRGVTWNPMPEAYDTFVYPDFTFRARGGKGQLMGDLIELFPKERAGIEKYFADIKRVGQWFMRYNMANALPQSWKALSSIVTRSGSKLALMTTREYLDRNFTDHRLKALLVSQWGDYGLPPSMSAFCIHAIIASHYLRGGYYPMGGSSRIAESIVPIIEESGGQALVNHHVREIMIENGRAVGVRVMEKRGNTSIEKEIRGDVVISGAGAWITYQELIPAHVPVPLRHELRDFHTGPGNVTLYLGLKDDPRKTGFMGENYWIYDTYDHEQVYRDRNGIINGTVRACYASFPSLKNPKATAHTIELIAFVDAEPFRRWADQPWKNRDEEYQILKEEISRAIIEFTNRRLPGIKDLIDYQELSTPLSTEFFTGHRDGSIYGLPATPARFRSKWLGPRTPIRNLYLTGSDAAAHGIVGAMMGGVATAGIVIGGPLGMFRILKTAKAYANRAEGAVES